MKFIVSFAMLSFSFLLCQAQGIKGLITDDKKQPIPFATIFIEKLQTGTNSNVKGAYEIALKPGTYKVLFRSLGYKPVNKEVVVGNMTSVIDVELATEVYQIKEVIIKKGEDPAYPIMRKVIAWAPYHLNQVKHYKSDVYLKGTMVIDHIPGIVKNKVSVGQEGKTDKIKSGDVYLGESVNEISFDAPDKYTLLVKSSQTSFPNLGNEAITPTDFIKSSLYQSNFINCISPCSPDAFKYYHFVYEGYFEEDGIIIDKIRIEPKRKSQQLFSGHLYIVEQYWTIQTADLFNEQFWGDVNISQLCTPIKSSVWMPVSYNFHINFSIFGFKVQYRYASSVKYSEIEIDKNLTGPVVTGKAIVAESLSSKRDSVSIDEELQALLTKDKLSYRDMRKLMKVSKREKERVRPDTLKTLEIKIRQERIVDPEAKKRDSAYWSQNRAIPLTADEIRSYQKKDSIIQKAAADTAKAEAKKRKFGIVGKMISGFTVPQNKSSLTFRYDGLIKLNGISFNTVDGWDYKQSFHVNWQIDSVHHLYIDPELKYAFNRKELMGYFKGGYDYAPMRNGSFVVNAGVNSVDFNQYEGIKVFENSIASLFFRRNYMKLFEKKYLNLGNDIDLANGLRLNTSFGFAELHRLKDHTDYSFFYRNSRDYTPNIPDNDFFSIDQPEKTRSFTLSAGLTYTPGYHYRLHGGKKEMLWSKYPTFKINYKKAIDGVFDSHSKYHLVTGGMSQTVKLKYGASLEYDVQLGGFLNVGQIHFSEFKHFNTLPLPLTISRFEQSFQLLDFYKYSTSQHFLEGHLHYQSQLLLLKYLPLLSFTTWSENLYFNYLSTPVLKNYTEIGYGLNNIMFLANIGVFASFENGTYKSVGAKLSINFGR